MAEGISQHIHLGLGNPPVETYRVKHGGMDTTPNVPVVLERSITGKLHVHYLSGDDGPVHLEASRLVLHALSWQEKETVLSLIGRRAYYIPHLHDDDNLSEYVRPVVVLVPPGGVVNIDPRCTYWDVTVELVDDSL